MNNKRLKYAYSALLHDIGKFYQRAYIDCDLSLSSLEVLPRNKKNELTHLHAAYTYDFLKQVLQVDDDILQLASRHHIDQNVMSIADEIASNIDQKDEVNDNENAYKENKFAHITSRLQAITSEVDFGSEKQKAFFPLHVINNLEYPNEINKAEYNQAILTYKNMFDQFVSEVNKEQLLVGSVTPYKYHRMYSLLYKYTTLIPSSNYKVQKQSVSLFDHLKLTSAIASCMNNVEEKRFYMFEFDISGIQNFIYHISEGSEQARNVAKSLRGRSAYVALLSNAITYSMLKEFELTQANVIFNTGGGGLILLPYLQDTKERVHTIYQKISKELYRMFNTSLTFVYSLVELDDKELESFKSDKALMLKNQLDDKKKQKYDSLIDEAFTFDEMNGDYLCNLCNDYIVSGKGKTCATCNKMMEISQYYIEHDSFNIYYLFDSNKMKSQELEIDFGFVRLIFDSSLKPLEQEEFYYVDAINHFEAGNVKMVANLVPKNEYRGLNFEEIATSLGSEYGDQKLAVLKMDVDNLGAIFAFGLKQDKEAIQARSLSKYLAMSRFMEYFFSSRLKQLCKEVTKELDSDLNSIFYINYAGGDDLLIIGPVYGIVYLANAIRQEFKAFVCNDDISLSGGIYIQTAKKPIRFGIKEADHQLDLSKDYQVNNRVEKNAISMMDYTVSFNDFNILLEKVTKYSDYILNNDISRTSFYNIMSSITDRTMEDYYSSIPRIEYTALRVLGKDNSIRKELLEDIAYAKNKYELDQIVLMMKLVILFTREE